MNFPAEMSLPPPNFQAPGNFHQPRQFHPNFHHKPFFKSYKHGMQIQDDFDGKRLRKSVMRKTVDYNSSIVKALEVYCQLISFKHFLFFNISPSEQNLAKGSPRSQSATT